MAAMTEPLLSGTRDWDRDAWLDTVYPAELPREWRFCYYSNLLRSVLVPGAVSAQATVAEVTQWWEDCDTTFRFVLECPPEFARPQAPGGCSGGRVPTIAPLGAGGGVSGTCRARGCADAAWLLVWMCSVRRFRYAWTTETPVSAARCSGRPWGEPVLAAGGRPVPGRFLVALMRRRARRAAAC